MKCSETKSGEHLFKSWAFIFDVGWFLRCSFCGLIDDSSITEIKPKDL